MCYSKKNWGTSLTDKDNRIKMDKVLKTNVNVTE